MFLIFPIGVQRYINSLFAAIRATIKQKDDDPKVINCHLGCVLRTSLDMTDFWVASQSFFFGKLPGPVASRLGWFLAGLI